MNYKLIAFLLLSVLLKIENLYSQILVTDTIAYKYYVKYQVDEATKVKNGSYEMIYKDKTLTKGFYKDNKRTGAWEFIGVNDTLQQSGFYVDGKRDGEWKFYYSNSKLSCNMPYKNGMKNGNFKGYFSNGNPSFEKSYFNDSVIGVETEYYLSGKISKTRTFLGDSLNGISKSYYENGTIEEQKFMKGNIKDGECYSYYENGAIREHIIFKSGCPYNVIANNDLNGKPLDFGTIKDGNGTVRSYDVDGNERSEETYKNSILNGFARYSRKGVVVREGNYLNGKLEGIWIMKYGSGKISSRANYISGSKEGVMESYSQNGSISQKGQFIEDKKSGFWVSYNEKEELMSELNYLDDLLNGDAKYFVKGKLKSAGKYNKGVKIYKWTEYDETGKEISVSDYGYTFVNKDDIKKNIPEPPVYNSEATYSIAERMPSFPGGEKMMMEFIQKNIVYPQLEKESGIQGTVYVTFIVDNIGEISGVKILRGVAGGVGCDNEAKRIIGIMPRWTPGMQNGRPVNVSFNLPIKYLLK